jgi:hypothetical protein
MVSWDNTMFLQFESLQAAEDAQLLELRSNMGSSAEPAGLKSMPLEQLTSWMSQGRLRSGVYTCHRLQE